MKIQKSDHALNHLKVDDIICQQHFSVVAAIDALHKFIIDRAVNISVIVEIGTSFGGFTRFIAQHDLGKACKIFTFDIDENKQQKSNLHALTNVEFQKHDVFSSSLVENIINGNTNNTIVFCDGGAKEKEFNHFSKFLKKNDMIFCHDYITSSELFLSDYKDKIWNWHESRYKNIEASVNNYNLEPLLPEYFLPAVWGSFMKIQ